MTAETTLQESREAGAAVLEIERFEWAAPDRIELAGVWSGLRGRRFIRPTLVLEGEGERRRLLATLEHKPWTADDGEEWIAAFAWNGPVVKFESADLNVGSGIDLKLPPPRMRPGKPRRFRQSVVSRDGTRDPQPERVSGPGIVSDPPGPAGDPPTQSADPPAQSPDAPVQSPNAPAREPSRTPDAASAAVEALRVELDRVRAARDRYHEERDAALEQVKAARADTESERQLRERAIADARADERGKAAKMLAEGAELRAAVERQRELAYHARDEAERVRDSAVAARERAVAEMEEAVRLRREAERDRDAAFGERDRANKERDRAVAEREAAERDREEALEERDAATQERDTIVSVHERGLPVLEPKARFLPPERRAPRSDLEIWMPRVVAVCMLFLFLLVVVHLFGGP
jgi:hypothetical protein